MPDKGTLSLTAVRMTWQELPHSTEAEGAVGWGKSPTVWRAQWSGWQDQSHWPVPRSGTDPSQGPGEVEVKGICAG